MMPTYHVTITRTLILSTTVTVRDKTEDEAEKKALEQVRESLISWEINDKNEWNEESDDCTADQIDED